MRPQAKSLPGIIQPDIISTEEMSELIAEYGRAKTHTRRYTNDFKSLDNLVDGVPVDHQKGSPYVGDTTLAGLVRSIPRDSLQQLPVFGAKINGSKESNEAIIASYILRRGVFNEDTFGKGLLSTMQLGAEQALTHGYAPFMTATGNMFDEFGTTMRLLHYADCAPEPGIQDANEAGFFYVVANITKTRLRRIRDAAMENENTSWYVHCLDKLLEMEPTTRNYSIYQSDPQNKGAVDHAPTYEFITKYEVGKGGKFITFCPQIEDEPLRVINNKSKFGYPRVQFLVIDPAALSPFGTSRVRLASPNQNLMNAYHQNIASMLILNSDPPILKRGRFMKPVQLKRKAVWEAKDMNADAKLITIDNGALESFVQISQQMSAQIQNMMGKPTKGSDYGNTSPGAKATIKKEDNATNQITNILESFLRQYALVALDTYIAEQTVEDYNPEEPIEEDIILDDEAKIAINQLAESSFVATVEAPTFVPPVGDDNKLTIDWNKYYGSIETMGVDIELSIGKDELEEKQRGDLQDMLTVMEQNLDPNDPNYSIKSAKISELQDRLLEKTVPGSKPLPTTPPNPVGNPNYQPATPGQTTPVSDQVSITQ